MPCSRRTKPKPAAATRRGRKKKVEALGEAPAAVPVAASGEVPAGYDPLRAAFYVSWDPSSLASLQLHYRDIDLLIPEQLHSIAADGRLDVDDDPKLAAWMKSQGIKIPIMPLLNNSDGTIWHVSGDVRDAAQPRGARALGAAARRRTSSKASKSVWRWTSSRCPRRASTISWPSSAIWRPGFTMRT